MGSWGHRRTKQLGIGLACVLAASLATACGASSSGNGKSGPIKVGYEVPLTGNFAQNGQLLVDGFKLGLKQLGDTVNGRKIEVSYVDTHGDPATALADARKLVNDGISIMEGPLVSSESAAVTPFLGQRKIPVDDLTLCSQIQVDTWAKAHNGMTSSWTCDQPALMGAVWAYNEMHWRHITLVAQDFSFGWQVIGGFAQAFKQLGGTITNVIYVPLNATDLSSYVGQIPKNTDAVYTEMSGGFAVKFTNAYQSFGLHKQIPLLGITQLTGQSALPSEKADAVEGDVYTDAQYCDGIDTPENHKFVDAFVAQYHTRPGYYSDAGYVRAQVLIAALKSLKGDTSDPSAVSAAMRAAKVSAPRGPVSISTETHSPIQNIYICKVEAVNGTLANVPIKTYTNAQPQGQLDYDSWLARLKHDGGSRPKV
jgi:ABC-type branched-chain amino acid transport systems, periplasmic component